MATLGGKDVNESLRKIFRYLFPNAVLAQFSWRGTKEKQAFKEFINIKKMIFDSVKSNHELVTVAHYDKFVKDYVRYSKYRKVSFFSLV